ncbi:MAG: TonB-dependent receptor [Candidatus Omnitrophica bacterium]|nr:TonB-dependent receptor [Candidatus Omnitrophota bacterium]
MASDLFDLLSLDSAVFVAERGAGGVQADVGIRGATPEETVVSINGASVNDPQTAHHNLDIPIPMSALESIQITKAASPYFFGQGAMGGNLNLVTRRPEENICQGKAAYGSEDTRETGFYVSRADNEAGVNAAFEERSSDGWRHNTDARTMAASSSVLWEPTSNISTYALAAYGEKEFGANGFYGAYDSKEWTDTTYLSWNTELRFEDWTLKPQLYSRRHHDKYILDVWRPDYYRNDHQTDIRGLIVEGEKLWKGLGILTAGVNAVEEKLISNRLGRRGRDRFSSFVSWRAYEDSARGYDVFVRLDDFSPYGTKVLPGGGLYMRPMPKLKLRSTVSAAARAPTFTELYYVSPANVGNPDLAAENALNVDAGMEWGDAERDAVTGGVEFFERWSDDLIDWVKDRSSQSAYVARNVTRTVSRGLEVSAEVQPARWWRLSGNYTLIRSDIQKDPAVISKYALNHPEHRAVLRAALFLAAGEQDVTLSYQDKSGMYSEVLVDATLRYRLRPDCLLFLKMKNLGNTSHEDFLDSPLPGREFLAGLTFDL